ncbi:MAG: aldehyde dehydrogenase family protein [Luteitalea sp.]|nr:aldehyde dehydrogenase family protein [Luteitalea sp.]
MSLESRNPATGELLASFEPHGQAAIEDRLGRAAAAFRSWKQTSFDERARLLDRVADLLESDRERLARLMTLEMGKLLRAAGDEIIKSARACRFYAQHGAAFLADEDIATEAARSYIRYEPVGPVFAIMPWNFPFWQVFRFAAPALMAGNVALLKHAPNVPQCALAIEALFQTAGAPDGVFQTLLIEVDQVPPILEDERVSAVTLTGSDRAGRDVASRAGRALKKSVLELGGSDPFIVMPSADVTTAVATAVKSRTLNSGQSCIAAKRFVVSEAVADEFLHQFVAAMAALKIGDPLDAATDVGPMARADLVDALSAQVDDAVARGARVLTGGAPLSRAGHFYPPTVLVDIPTDARVYREELFGPVASVFRVNDLDEAIALANDTPYGLAASVWTKDAAERDRFVDALEVGQVFVNAMVASDPRVPFGGVKRSGYGRELGPHGIRELTQVKAVWVM